MLKSKNRKRNPDGQRHYCCQCLQGCCSSNSRRIAVHGGRHHIARLCCRQSCKNNDDSRRCRRQSAGGRHSPSGKSYSMPLHSPAIPKPICRRCSRNHRSFDASLHCHCNQWRQLQAERTQAKKNGLTNNLQAAKEIKPERHNRRGSRFVR